MGCLLRRGGSSLGFVGRTRHPLEQARGKSRGSGRHFQRVRLLCRGVLICFHPMLAAVCQLGARLLRWT